MKISPDQNTITLDDGTVLVAARKEIFCTGCHFFKTDTHECAALHNDSVVCSSSKRSVIFIKEQK